MSVEQNKALMQRWAAAMNDGDWAALDDVLAAAFVYTNPSVSSVHTRDEFKQLMVAMRTGFPPGRWTVDDIVGEGDKVAGRLTFRGVHSAPYRGVPPTGREITMENLVISRIAGGKVVESRALSDSLGLLVSIGAIPAPA